jgi:adenylosuccinate synthase
MKVNHLGIRKFTTLAKNIEFGETMQTNKFNLLVDQSFGSSGKGKMATWLTDHHSITYVSSANYPNAGHTAAFEDGTKFVAKAIPTAAILKKTHGMGIQCFISPGSGFGWNRLIQEWQECDQPTIYIHERASIVTPEHAKREREGSDSTKHIASTMQGSGTAIADKVLRKPDVLLAGTNIFEDIIDAFEESDEFKQQVMDKIHVIDGMEFRNLTHSLLEHGNTFLHEGSQGYALSIDHGFQFPNCLWKDSRVLMANGKTIKISELKSHVGEEVVSINKKGQICNKPIINWWKNPLGDREWFNIVTETSVYNNYDQQWIGPKFTGDHKIKTPAGIRKVSNLKPGDQVFINEYEFTGDGLQVFLGSVLGDGSIPNTKKSPKRASLQFSHCEEQKAYCIKKAEIIKNYVDGRLRTIITGDKSFKQGQKQTRFETYYSLTVKKLATNLGSFGKKTNLNVHLLMSLIDERGLAIWYQDDGSYKHANNGKEVFLHTNGFNLDTQKELVSALKTKFDLQFSIYKQNRNGIQYFLRLSRKDHKKWFSIIHNYIHPIFQYKLPDAFKACWKWTSILPSKCATETILEIVKSRTRPYRGESVCFDIEIEDTHNFFVANDKGYFNVENCTSRNCDTQAAMDYMAIPPQMVGDIYLNLRTYPIRVGNCIEDGIQKGYSGDFYSDCKELTWEEIAKKSGMPPEEANKLAERERTTVTKRIRRPSGFSFIGLKDAVRTNGATKLILNFMQYIDWSDNKLRDFNKLSKKSRDFIDKIEQAVNLPIVLIGTGPLHTDVIAREELL